MTRRSSLKNNALVVLKAEYASVVWMRCWFDSDRGLNSQIPQTCEIGEEIVSVSNAALEQKRRSGGVNGDVTQGRDMMVAKMLP